uniref:Uncharacterized protein n=1 Tax=uncultured marine crenarchaeote HF4000_APKG2O16 TaxID=455582 RepID=B3T703_9ARCH|nr:hypothetical protein ALOHA_HF4000APKG2O16ctg10g8 [uncultured marine crenarchaeote HF4000_APKG2O16]
MIFSLSVSVIFLRMFHLRFLILFHWHRFDRQSNQRLYAVFLNRKDLCMQHK